MWLYWLHGHVTTWSRCAHTHYSNVFSWGEEVIDSSGKGAVARSSASTVCSFADHDEHFNLAGLPARFQYAVMRPTSKSILERNFPFQEIRSFSLFPEYIINRLCEHTWDNLLDILWIWSYFILCAKAETNQKFVRSLFSKFIPQYPCFLPQ